MSERVVDERQSRASDIIGVLSGVGLYSALIFLVTFLCLYVRLEAGDRLRLGGLCSTCDGAISSRCSAARRWRGRSLRARSPMGDGELAC